MHSSQDLLNQTQQTPTMSAPKTKTKKIIRKVRRVSKKNANNESKPNPFQESRSTTNIEAAKGHFREQQQSRESKDQTRDHFRDLKSDSRVSNSPFQSRDHSERSKLSTSRAHRSKTLSAESGSGAHFSTGHLHGVSSHMAKSNGSLSGDAGMVCSSLVKTTSKDNSVKRVDEVAGVGVVVGGSGGGDGQTRRVTKVIKKKKIIRKVKKTTSEVSCEHIFF